MAATRKFFRYEKILSLAKVIEFRNCENIYNYIACVNFNFSLPKVFLKIFSFYSFGCTVLKLSGYVLGTKTKLPTDQNFDLDFRGENIGF